MARTADLTDESWTTDPNDPTKKPKATTQPVPGPGGAPQPLVNGQPAPAAPSQISSHWGAQDPRGVEDMWFQYLNSTGKATGPGQQGNGFYAGGQAFRGNLAPVVSDFNARTGLNAKVIDADKVDFGRGAQDVITSGGDWWLKGEGGGGAPGGAGGGGGTSGAPMSFQDALSAANQYASTKGSGGPLTDAEIAQAKNDLGYQEGAMVDPAAQQAIKQWIDQHRSGGTTRVDDGTGQVSKTGGAGGPGTTGDLGKGDASALYQMLLKRATQGLSVDPNDPVIRNQVDAYGARQTQASRDALSAEAESQGPNANLSAETRSAAEKAGQNTSDFQSRMLYDEVQGKKKEIQDALTSMGSLLSDQQRLALQEQLAKLSLAQQQLQFTSSQAQQESQFGRTQQQLESQFGRNLTQRELEFIRSLQQRGYEFDTTQNYLNSPLNG